MFIGTRLHVPSIRIALAAYTMFVSMREMAIRINSAQNSDSVRRNSTSLERSKFDGEKWQKKQT